MTLSLFPRTAAAALAVATTLTALPAQADWIGGGYLANPWGCEAAGWPRGVEMFRARYVPAEDGGMPTSSITLDLAVGGSMAYIVRGELTPSDEWRNADGYAVWGSLYRSSPAPVLQVTQRWSATTGDAWLPRTHEIRMTVRIGNFNGRYGCSVDAIMMLRDERSTLPTY